MHLTSRERLSTGSRLLSFTWLQMGQCEKHVGKMGALLEESWLEVVINAFQVNVDLFVRIECLFPGAFASECNKVVDQVVLVSPIRVSASDCQQL